MQLATLSIGKNQYSADSYRVDSYSAVSYYVNQYSAESYCVYRYSADSSVSIGTVQIATVSIGTVQIATVSIGTVQIATVSIDTVQIATLSIPHYLPFRNSNFHQYQTEREEGTPMSQQPSIYRSLLVQNKVSACKQTELYSQQFSVQCY